MTDHNYPIGALFFVTWVDTTRSSATPRRWALYVRADDGGYDCLIDASRRRSRPRDPMARARYPIGHGHEGVPAGLEPVVHMLMRHDQIDKVCKLVGDPWKNRGRADG